MDSYNSAFQKKLTINFGSLFYLIRLTYLSKLINSFSLNEFYVLELN